MGKITYQEQFRRCGKHGCHCREGQRHGPYLYAYWREGGRLVSKYLGKILAATALPVPVMG